MRFHVLACDYDGTVAHDGVLDAPTLKSLERLRASGRKLVLVTGRELDELLEVCPDIGVFDNVVAENGAVLYLPSTKEERALAPPPPEALWERLEAQGVTPLSKGRVIIATREPYQNAALEAIRDLSLEIQVIFNKGAVMLLPSGVNKATGLQTALSSMGYSPHNAVAVGDAENDHALFNLCGCSVAVANAVSSLKERADWVTSLSRGEGVAELADRLIASDLASLWPNLSRHRVVAGMANDQEVTLPAAGTGVLIAGTSGGGKTTLATGILERLALCKYQLCIVDPEGDYENFHEATAIGDANRPPTTSEVLNLLADPAHNAVVNLVGLPLADRPRFLREMLGRLHELSTNTGRPHWLVLDEVHHMLPAEAEASPLPIPPSQSLLIITVEPEAVAPAVLAQVDTMMAIGADPTKGLRAFAERVGAPVPSMDGLCTLQQGEALMWRRTSSEMPFLLRGIPPTAERRRHRRKYAEGDLGEDRSFYFRGRDQKLNLRVQNLILFIQIAEGVGDDVWSYHLHRGDYSSWFLNNIKDPELAAEAEVIERHAELSAAESRKAILESIRARYTAPASSL